MENLPAAKSLSPITGPKLYDPVGYYMEHLADANLVPPGTKVYLFRGCNEIDARDMCVFKCAYGKIRHDQCGRPSEKAISAQVSNDVIVRDASGSGFTRIKLPEFTYNPGSLMMHKVKSTIQDPKTGQLAKLGIAVCLIEARYLVIGDKGVMKGVCCKNEAPIEFIGFVTDMQRIADTYHFTDMQKACPYLEELKKLANK